MNRPFKNAYFGCSALALTFAAGLTLAVSRASAKDSPYAVEVISYNPGAGVVDYDNPLAALGEPTRFTGMPPFEAVVSAFNPPWALDDIVSIGPGGHLIVRFDSPAIDHPGHPYGIDLLIFGNAGFFDSSWPNGIVGGLFGDDGGIVEVSEDGETWHLVREAHADGMFPTIGYLDAGPYDVEPGRANTEFTRAVDPSLTLDDFLGLDHDGVLALYDGSGGGAGIDISTVGLAHVLYVRVSNPPDAFVTVEIDGFAKVRPVVFGDLNGDGVVDVFDLLILLSAWGACPSAEPRAKGCPADLNGDGVVDVFDLLILLANWG